MPRGRAEIKRLPGGNSATMSLNPAKLSSFLKISCALVSSVDAMLVFCMELDLVGRKIEVGWSVQGRL